MMGWSSMLRTGLTVGLSGTSLALAVGCASPDAEPIRATQDLEVVARDTAATASDALARRERERRAYAEADARVDADLNGSGDAPWFLRPVGETQPGSVTTPVVAQPVVAQPEVQPIRQNNPLPIAQPQPKGKNWGWRAACGRG